MRACGRTLIQTSTFTRFEPKLSLSHPVIKISPIRLHPFRVSPPITAPACGIRSTFSSLPETIPADDESQENANKDTFEHLLTHQDTVTSLMKMERKPDGSTSGTHRWFPYTDKFRCGGESLTSGEVLDAVVPHMTEERMGRFRRVAANRSYSICLVVEGLSDFGNISAAFRSADALGLQSVHVVACDSSKRYRDNRHVSMGAEKWLDIELWNSPKECFEILKSRGYRIATTHVGIDAVSIYNMDWSLPTAIVVGNESRGISEEALNMSDLHCSIPMNGMVDSFNVSVAAGIVMHHAVSDRTSRLGPHGDLKAHEAQILLAEFALRHSKSAISVAYEYAKRKAARATCKTYKSSSSW